MIMDCEKYVGKCVCGRDHELETKKVVVEYGAINNFEQYMADVGLAGKSAPLSTIRSSTSSPRASTSPPIRRSCSRQTVCVPRIRSSKR